VTRSLHLFFDLDGTLTDSAEGIVACIQHALVQLERTRPAAAEIRSFIGSPLRSIFENFLSDDETGPGDAELSTLTSRAIEFYRERFDAEGFSQNRLYVGVREGLGRLRASHHTLYVATAKRPEDALRVTRHFELDGFFAGVFGAQSDDERNDKARLLARALESSGAPAAESIMVGDRSHDMLAACRTGATPLGAGWGYGSAHELREAGAIHIASSPAEMIEWIGERALAPGRSPEAR
jgi:phosphoglycolate phosphatase